MVNKFEGFKRATIKDYERHRLFASSWGRPGSRKTSFWLEGPSPVAIFSLNKGLEGVVDRVLREQPDKEIYVREYDWEPGKDPDPQQSAIEVRDQFSEDFERMIPQVRTAIVDLEPEFWSLFRCADGVSQGDDQKDYGPVNARYRTIVNIAKAHNVNMGFIGGAKDKWGEITKRSGQKGQGPLGEDMRSGWKELDGNVHLVLRHEGIGPNDWSITVGKVRGPATMELAGQTLPSLSFQELALMVFPESEPEEWI